MIGDDVGQIEKKDFNLMIVGNWIVIMQGTLVGVIAGFEDR